MSVFQRPPLSRLTVTSSIGFVHTSYLKPSLISNRAQSVVHSLPSSSSVISPVVPHPFSTPLRTSSKTVSNVFKVNQYNINMGVPATSTNDNNGEKYPKIKLSYFDLPARGELCRLAMIIGGIPFEDDRVEFSQFPELRPSLPLGSLPIVEIDGKQVHTQSMAILRYLGKLGGLYPKDPLQALYVDEVNDTILDFFNSLFKYSGSDEQELKKHREEAIEIAGKRYWGGAQSMIEKRNPNGVYVLDDNQVTIADIGIAGIYVLFQIERLDYIPKDALHGYKRMKAIHDKIMEIPEVVYHYEKHPIEQN